MLLNNLVFTKTITTDGYFKIVIIIKYAVY